MVILNELPFKFVEEKGFKRCMSVACPRFRIPSQWTIARDCYQLYMDEKISLKKFLKSSSQKVSLTTDTWTSLQKVNYMCLTTHFLDNDQNLNKKILNVFPISSHINDVIGKAREKCLRDWGIDRVFTITIDNASSNDVVIACITDIVNLIVNEGLKEHKNLIARVKGAMKHVR